MNPLEGLMKRLLLSLALTALTTGGGVQADDNLNEKDADDEVTRALSKLAELGPGVHKVVKDKKGRIERLVGVGQARVNTSLGAATGQQVAQKKALLGAKAEMVRFLKEKVAAYQKSEEEVVFFEEGSGENDGDEVKRSGKRVEKNTERMESVAEGVVRGLQLLHKEVSSKEKTCTVVMGWDAATSDATKKVKKDLESDEPAAGGSGKKEDKRVKDKKVTSLESPKQFEEAAANASTLTVHVQTPQGGARFITLAKPAK